MDFLQFYVPSEYANVRRYFICLWGRKAGEEGREMSSRCVEGGKKRKKKERKKKKCVF